MRSGGKCVRITLLVIILTLFCSTVSSAEEKQIAPPHLINLQGKSGGVSGYLIGECEPRGTYSDIYSVSEITCHLSQVFIRNSASPNPTDSERIEDWLEDDLENFCSGWEDELEEDLSDEIREALQFEEFSSAVQKVCSAESTKDRTVALQEFFSISQQLDERTCEVTSFPFLLNFTKQPTGVWIAEEKPPLSQCGIVNLITLRSHQGKGFLWTYEARRIVTNPDGEEFSGERCKERELNEPIVYSWDGGPLILSCKVFN
jgi:hypothetical protein